MKISEEQITWKRVSLVMPNFSWIFFLSLSFLGVSCPFNLDPGQWKSPLSLKNNGSLSPLSFLLCKALGRLELTKGVVVVVAGVVNWMVVVAGVVVIMVVGVVILVVVVAGVVVVVCLACFTARNWKINHYSQ